LGGAAGSKEGSGRVGRGCTWHLAQELLDVGLLGGDKLARKGEGFALQELSRGEARILLGRRM